jgi:hypothetical protein
VPSDVWVLEGEAGHVVGVFESLFDILVTFPDSEWRPEGDDDPVNLWSNFRHGRDYLECWPMPVRVAPFQLSLGP